MGRVKYYSIVAYARRKDKNRRVIYNYCKDNKLKSIKCEDSGSFLIIDCPENDLYLSTERRGRKRKLK